MQMPQSGGAYCVAATGTTTAAMKAARTLQAIGITAEVVSLLPEETRRGCAFGVSFACRDLGRARNALRNARIPVSEYTSR